MVIRTMIMHCVDGDDDDDVDDDPDGDDDDDDDCISGVQVHLRLFPDKLFWGHLQSRFIKSSSSSSSSSP